jgi:thioredoxin reductase (NADPH)
MGDTAEHDLLFPKLSDRLLALLERHGRRQSIPAGSVVVAQGQQHAGFIVVLRGAIDVIRREDDVAKVVSTFGPREFGGEFSTLGKGRSIIEARAREDTEALVLEAPELRAVLASDSELNDLVTRALIERRLRMIRYGFGGVRLIGSRHSADTLRLREFLTRNSHPYVYLDVEDDAETASLLERLHIRPEEVPIVIWTGTQVLRNPSNRAVAECLGFSGEISGDRLYDFAIVGAGPAGLAAAVYAASEGLSVIVLDADAPGGQAGASSKIENYLGFPTGVSGQELAGRAFVQARKFGAEFVVAREVARLRCGEGHPMLDMADGDFIRARAVLIASGARYRKPGVADLPRFEGRGVYYRASHMEAQFCRDQEVVIIGGGNSAGQASVFLANHARHVHILVRGEGLARTMSRYLIQRIESTANITLYPRTEVTALKGDEHLEGVTWRGRDGGESVERAIGHVFVFIGADPNTQWLQDCVALDDKGFVRTGNDLRPDDFDLKIWNRPRLPFGFETNRPGVFAAGDVRSGSVKRVASSVGEGAITVQFLHAFLQE